jgi:signal transduction histidine kinase
MARSQARRTLEHVDEAKRVVLPEPGAPWRTGGIYFDGMFFPRWVLVLSAVIGFTGTIASLAEGGITPLRMVFTAGALLPWACDAGIVAFPRLSLWTRDQALHLYGAPAIAVPSLLLLAKDPSNIGHLVLIYLVGEWATHSRPRASVTIFGAAAAGIAARMVTAHGHGLAQAWQSWLIGIGCAWAVGTVFQSQVRLITRLRAAQASLAEQVAADERRRIAREVHDVIAHSLAVTMLHLTGARLTLEHDPAATAEAIGALEEAERAGRESLLEIRRTVGLLANPAQDGQATQPLPGAADLDLLVADFASAGLDVTLRTTGVPNIQSRAVGLALYRIVQESLANAAKHAPASTVAVELAFGPEIVLRVRNTLTAGTTTTEGGLGLPGMEERARMVGGTCAAGRTNDGWLVEVSLPDVPSATLTPA